MAVTDDPVLFDRMLLLGHYGRLKKGQAAGTFDTDYLSLGVKYRPHLYAMLLALGSLVAPGRAQSPPPAQLRDPRAELAGCPAVQPIETTPGARTRRVPRVHPALRPGVRGGAQPRCVHRGGGRGGRPDRAPSATRRSASAARMLHQSPIFTGRRHLGWSPAASHLAAAGARTLPVTESPQGPADDAPAVHKVRERFVRECARALRKVADEPASPLLSLAIASSGRHRTRRRAPASSAHSSSSSVSSPRPSPRDAG